MLINARAIDCHELLPISNLGYVTMAKSLLILFSFSIVYLLSRDGSLHIHVSEKSSGKSVGVTVEHG